MPPEMISCLAVHAQILQRLHRRPTQASVGWLTFSMNTLRRGCAALHAVDHDDVGAGLHGSAVSQ
jgi:hypothetical protein